MRKHLRVPPLNTTPWVLRRTLRAEGKVKEHPFAEVLAVAAKGAQLSRLIMLQADVRKMQSAAKRVGGVVHV